MKRRSELSNVKLIKRAKRGNWRVKDAKVGRKAPQRQVTYRPDGRY